MRLSWIFALFIFLALNLVLPPTTVLAEGKFKLKPQASGKLCLGCHSAFTSKLKAKHIHTPLEEGQCTGCHNPHASSHGMLMDAESDQLCYKCHEKMIPENAASVHKIVADGDCVACHDPHSSDNTANLIKPGAEMCFECHEELGERIATNKYDHTPVKQNCMTCHEPHASAGSLKLIKTEQPGLCLECHNTSSQTFKSRHMNYPVEQRRCTSCHDPHGSNSGAILADNVHEPILNEMCNQCHNEPNSADPFGIKKDGYQLCQGCHYETINSAFGKKYLHWPMVDNTGCVNCHTPHASNISGLLKDPMINVCGDCHADTIARQARSVTKHQPISDGECTICHSPHGSDNSFLQLEASIVNTCAQCHDWQTHSTHPIGEKFVDPRNPNLALDCSSCHRTHGTEYKEFIYYPDIQTLCVQCHTKYRR
jgi:DmsE family decaheme c-type cytochrome